MNEKISVIIPVYQVEKYLVECIDSVCNQNYKNLEIILVDDGGKDNSGAICDEYAKKDKRIKVIHKKNGGLSDARNAGIEKATGKYICFIDSDDSVSQKYIEDLYYHLIKNNADISICSYQEIYSKEDIREIVSDNRDLVYTSKETLKNMYSKDIGIEMIVAWNKLYKIELFNDIRYPIGKIHEDEFTTYKLIYKAKKIVYFSEQLYYYYQRNNGSIMRSSYNEKRLDYIEAMEERLKFYKKKNEKELYEITFQYYCYMLVQNYVCCRLYLKEKKDLYMFLKKKMRKNWKFFIKINAIPFKSKISYTLNCAIPAIAILRMKKYLDRRFRKKEKKSMIKQKIKRFLKICKYKIYKIKVKFNYQKEIILFSTPLHGNLGDHAIAIAEYKMLKDNKLIPFEVATGEKDSCYNYLLNHIGKDAIICITGGGFIGSQWLNEEEFVRQIIHDYSNHKIVIFPQTFYYKDDENGRKEYQKSKKIYEKARNLNIFVREAKSLEIAKTMLPKANVILVPDIVLYLEPKDYGLKREKVLLCIRHDVESKLKEDEIKKIKEIVKKYGKVEYTDTVINKSVKARTRKKEVRKKLGEFASSKLVITDRLHGMIFAYLTKTPCVAIGNYNYKVKGVYEWIKYCPYIKFFDSIDEVKENVDKLYNMKFTEENESFIHDFDILKEILQGEKENE